MTTRRIPAVEIYERCSPKGSFSGQKVVRVLAGLSEVQLEMATAARRMQNEGNARLADHHVTGATTMEVWHGKKTDMYVGIHDRAGNWSAAIEFGRKKNRKNPKNVSKGIHAMTAPLLGKVG